MTSDGGKAARHRGRWRRARGCRAASMDVFGDEEGGEQELRVNAAFASRFDDEATRRTQQRWREVGSRFPLGRAHVKALLAGAQEVAAAEGASAPPARQLLGAVMASRAWKADADAATMLDVAGPDAGAAAVDAATLARLCEQGALKKAIRAAFVYIKKMAHAAPEKAVKPAAAAGKAAGQKRARPGPDGGNASDTADAPALTTRGASSGAAVDGGSDGGGASAVAAAPRDSRRQAALPPAEVNVKRKGRGAGAGRGLDFRGEPRFDEMHPSWQAKRKAQRRQLKLVTKALRGGQGQDEVAVVVVEGDG